MAVTLRLGALVATGLVAGCLDRVRRSRIGPLFEQRREWVLVPTLMAADLLLVAHDLTHGWWRRQRPRSDTGPAARRGVQASRESTAATAVVLLAMGGSVE